MMSSDRRGGLQEETREAKIEKNDIIEGWSESKGHLTERDSLRESSEMDLVMNEEIHLAKKKGRAMGRSLLDGEPKKTKEWGQWEICEAAYEREWTKCCLIAGRRRGGGGERATDAKLESKKICSNSLWMCSGAGAIPQPTNRLCCHCSTVKKKKNWAVRAFKHREGSPREMFTHWVALCCIPTPLVPAGFRVGGTVLSDPCTLFETGGLCPNSATYSQTVKKCCQVRRRSISEQRFNSNMLKLKEGFYCVAL